MAELITSPKDSKIEAWDREILGFIGGVLTKEVKQIIHFKLDIHIYNNLHIYIYIYI